ncbi:ABC-type multidrug transport system, ATPase component [Halanaeroarchaeum sp. HSR-CO]|uniref:ABC transporter ATP-binding protein n=1 Tax=Halanaeroarchaeum sp. HSR-CO TaxID=2866382 RepID=UPI00217E1F47|nr:ABC transporter ATP-binding protein [Halanaeroarchaeum sp. HSR-CO]UWG48816.1 ABC-type multidrug transport system, ATPase component [Halanaeroarchaeum sp. HSR-CO]
MAAIETSGLSKRFGSDVLAVDDIDLTVAEGEIFGFLGPNGAGKSTTIDMLLDYVRPTEGTASVLGMDAQSETEAIHRRVGILPDDYGLYDRLTGYEHLDYAIELKRADDDPDALLDRVDLDRAAAERPVGGYSTGMAQRLVLAIALIGDPDLLVLDEPSSGLDPNGVRMVRDIARETAAAGGTVFFSSHILPQVEAVCDRVAILDRGRLVAVDTIDGLRDALGTGSTLSVTVDEIPETLALEEIDGVSAVTTGERTITVTCRMPETKLGVLDTIRDSPASILDFSTSEASLEELFQAYTRGEPSVEGPAR